MLVKVGAAPGGSMGACSGRMRRKHMETCLGQVGFVAGEGGSGTEGEEEDMVDDKAMR